MKVLFRRIGGRIVPIKVSQGLKDVAVATLTSVGVATAATKIRKNTIGSTGSGVGNFVFDAATSSVALAVLSKKFPAIGRGISLIVGRK